MFVFHCEMPLDNALVISQVVSGDMILHMPRGHSRNCRIDFFCRSRNDVRHRKSEIRRYIKHDVTAESPVSSLKPLKKKDWTNVWKKHFDVKRVSRRIIVKPSWKSCVGGKNDCILDVEPGMAFGTGEHVTTKTCLGLIDEFQRKCPGVSFLDAGCGSGILAIAAARLGFKPVHAIDNDPIAVKSARQNSVRNKVAGRVACRKCDLLRFKPGEKYVLIAANLFSNLLVSSSGCLAGLLECNNYSRLVISGILEKQYGAIKKAYLRQRLRETKKIVKQGWVTAVFKWKTK